MPSNTAKKKSNRTVFFKRKRLCVLCAALLFGTGSAAAVAQSAKSLQVSAEFAIPAQSMREALTRFGVQANLQIVYSSSLVENLASEGLSGSYSPREGLEKLLEGSGLIYEFIDKKSVIIVKAPGQPPTLSKPIPKPTPSTPPVEPKVIDRPNPLEIVTVTGSRLPRTQFDSPYPTQSVGPMTIQDGGHTTIADAINTLPVMCEPNFSLNSSGASNIGESYGDLYCLGSQRTLSLINGRRSVSSNEPAVPNSEPGLQVDLNMIPSIMVKNIEVIGVGSAPVYGSDAIGGTVNVLLRDNFDGFELDLQGGLSDLQDGEQANLGLLFGRDLFAGRGNVTLGYEYHRQEEVLARHRQYTVNNYDYVSVTPGTAGAGNLDYIFAARVTNPLLTRSGIPTPLGSDFPRFATGENRYNSIAGNPLSFNQNGRLQEFNLGDTTLDLDTTIGGDGVREQNFRILRLPAQRHSFALNANFDINDKVRAFSELQFYRAEFTTLGDSFEVVASSFTDQSDARQLNVNRQFNSLPIPYDYPFLDPADRSLLFSDASPGTDPQFLRFYLHKDWSSLIDPTLDAQTTTARGVVGLEGEFSLWQRDWYWEASANFGRSESESRSTRLQRDNFNRALDIALDPQSNRPVCLRDLENCVPLNVLGTQQSSQAIAYVTQEFSELGELEQDVYTLSLRGDVLSLHGGELGLVIGAERRREEAIYAPPMSYQEPRLPISPADLADIRVLDNSNLNEFTTAEIFVESIAPVLGEGVIPGVEKFELEANWRGVDHNIAGDDDAWALAARLSLNPEVLSGTLVLRANLTSSIRSPTLLELFLPFSPINSAVNDPCDTDFVNQGPNPASRRGNCIDEAARAGLAYDNENFESQVPRLAPLSLRGTESLKNEQARSTTFGAVYQSDGDGDLSVSLDAINIEIDDAIVLRNLQNVLNDCYDNSSESACADIVRITEFQLFGLQNAYQNIGQISLDAFQYTLKYRFEPASFMHLPGEFTFNLSAYQLKEFIVDDAQGIEDRRGSLRYPDWRGTGALNYQWQNLSLTWTSLYTGPITVDVPLSTADKQPEVDAYLFHTLAASYQFTDSLSARLGIQNVLDSDPPDGLPSTDAGSSYDVVGRYFSAGIKLSF